jgi:hypothetical protein
MTHAVRETSQDFTAQRFDVVGHCFVSERHADAHDRPLAGLDDEHEAGGLRTLLARLTGIVVIADTEKTG